KLSAFSFLDGAVIAADPGAVGEGISISLRREHLFAPRAFTSLMVNQAIVKAFDGVRVLEPWVVYLKPMHEDPELSWFETTGKAAADKADGPPKRSSWSWLSRLRARLAKASVGRSRARRRRPAIQGSAPTGNVGDRRNVGTFESYLRSQPLSDVSTTSP